MRLIPFARPCCRFFPLILTLSLLLLPGWVQAYQKGIALGLYAKDAGYSYKDELDQIRATGADHVSLVVSWYQKDIRSNLIYPRWKAVGDYETPPDSQIINVIKEAHQAGLKVFLFPILRIEQRAEKEWRGVVAPTNRRKWLSSYRRFTLHYARIASSHGVKMYSVGSELCSVENEERFWRALIAQIRRFYKGELLYSANWDHYRKVPFWDALDYLGLNGYYELTRNPEPTIQELVRRWWDIENEIANWQERIRKPILFTEIGYPSLDGGCGKPWDYTRNVPIDLEEQALCYEAFFLSWGKSSKLGGVYFWNWYGQGGENDRSYTPRGKPAEKILTQWYRDYTLPPWRHSLSSPSASSPAEAARTNSPGTSSEARNPSL